MVSKLKCPGCGALFSPSDSSLSQTYHASSACEGRYHELSAWLWSKDAESFPKQYAVDAYDAQHVGLATKDIRVAFSGSLSNRTDRSENGTLKVDIKSALGVFYFISIK